MKRAIGIIIFVLVCLAAAVIFVKPLIIFLAEKQIKKVFPSAAVSIKDCELKLLQQLRFLDIRFQDPAGFDFKAGELAIHYNLTSILQRTISKVYVKDAALVVNLPKKKFLDLTPQSSPTSAGALSAGTLEVSNLKLNVRLKDFNVEAGVSAQVDLIKAALNSVDLGISDLGLGDFRLKEGTVRISRLENSGELFIRKIQYGKYKAAHIRATVMLKGRELFLDALAGEALNGKFSGEASLLADKDFQYLAHMQFVNLDLDRLGSDLELKEKFQMSGLLNGNMTVSGRGPDINIMNGNFTTADPGGVLVIQDNQMLKNLADSTGLPQDIVVESFKNYHYNTGVMNLSLDEGNLVLDMALDGETGKRNINITLHDFN